MDLESLRKEYSEKALRKKDLANGPFDQFNKWFQEALKAEIVEANAMALATMGSQGVSNRMVLLKGFDQNGLLFFTDSLSRKAQDIRETSEAAVLFFWKELDRQVCVHGKVADATREEAEAYFQKRPRQSQIAAWASKQGEILDSRQVLEERFRELETKFKDQTVPTPINWFGYRLIPDRFEFWQGRESRLHDRFAYTLAQGVWEIKRLSP